MIERLALVLAVCLLSLQKTCLADPAMDTAGNPQQIIELAPDTNQRTCTLDELLPLPSKKGKSKEWSDDYIVEPPYNCTCPAIKARYFCPSQGRPRYPKWVPQPVASGLCTSATREELEVAPFPPNFKVLMYGNSHMRQELNRSGTFDPKKCNPYRGMTLTFLTGWAPEVRNYRLVFEAMMCLYQGAMTSKRVTYYVDNHSVQTMVESDSQCRACHDFKKPNKISELQRILLDNKCMAEDVICRCDDSHSEIFFENGATVHYTFAHQQHDKGLEDARREHGNETLSWYDAVIMNPGNSPPVTSDLAVRIAIEVQNAGAQFVWLSMYGGYGGVDQWPKDQRKRFFNSGAKFLDVSRMVEGMRYLTKGKVEGGSDPHFCLPGPPNEIAVLVLKLMWAVHDAAT